MMTLRSAIASSLVLILPLADAFGQSPTAAIGPPPAGHAGPTAGRAHAKDWGSLPFLFERNDGQADPRVAFLARAAGATIFLHRDGATFALGGGAAIAMRFEGASEEAAVLGAERLPGVTRYYLGNDPAKWVPAAPHFGRVQVVGLYAGVDAVYYGNPRKLEYDLLLEAGVDPAKIVLRFDGSDGIAVDADGSLEVRVGRERLVLDAPRVWQDRPDGRKELSSRWSLRNSARATFAIDGIDPALPLVIDPVVNLAYSTFLGGSSTDFGEDIAVGVEGDAWVTGETFSLDFPGPRFGDLTGGTADGGNFDAFLARFTTTGDALIAVTIIGSDADDFSFGVAHNPFPSTTVFVGVTDDPSTFPNIRVPEVAPRGSADGKGGPGRDAFLVAVDSSGNVLRSFAFGGSNDDIAYDVAFDLDLATTADGTPPPASPQVVIVGQTFSADYPVKGFQNVLDGPSDAFVSRFDTETWNFTLSTYFGGFQDEAAYGVAVDFDGSILFGGESDSDDLPTVAAVQNSCGGAFDGFLAALDESGTTLQFSSYLGGNDFDAVRDVAIRGQEILAVGETGSADFPTTLGSLQPNPPGPTGKSASGFVSIIEFGFDDPKDPGEREFGLGGDFADFVSSTYYGGNDIDVVEGVAITKSGDPVIVLWTSSTDLPVVFGMEQKAGIGSFDAAVARFNNDLSGLVYSTYLGGTLNDFGLGIAVDFFEDAYVTGSTESPDFPLANPFQDALNTPPVIVAATGDSSTEPDAFVTKLAFDPKGEGQIDLTVALGPNSPSAGATGCLGEANVLLQFTVTSEDTSTEDATLNSFDLTAFGTGDESAVVEQVRIVRDLDGDGAIDGGEPTIGTATFNADDGTVNLVLSTPQTLAPDETRTYLVVYDLGMTLLASTAAPSGNAKPSADADGSSAPASPVSHGWVLLLPLAIPLLRRRKGDGGRRVPTMLLMALLAIGCLSLSGCRRGNHFLMNRTFGVDATAMAAVATNPGTPITIVGLPIAGLALTVNQIGD